MQQHQVLQQQPAAQRVRPAAAGLAVAGVARATTQVRTPTLMASATRPHGTAGLVIKDCLGFIAQDFEGTGVTGTTRREDQELLTLTTFSRSVHVRLLRPLVALLYGQKPRSDVAPRPLFGHCCAVSPILNSQTLSTFLLQFLVACQSISSIDA